MLKLKSQPERPPRCNRRWRLLWLLLAGILVTLVTERWRGQWALKSWKGELAAKGEVFEAQRLWPPTSEASAEFSNALTQATGTFRGRLAYYSAFLSGIITESPGRYRRGSQGPRPLPLRDESSTNTWPDLDELLRQNHASLQTLRELMKHPPATMGLDIARRLEKNDSLPPFVPVRIGAQTLKAAVMNDLHKGDLDQAGRDLVTLLAFAKLYEQDPSLVNYMIRIAIIGLSVDVWWDALQDPRWTEPQMATLQEACLDTGRILSQLPQALAAERAAHLYQGQWFRSHSYQSWLNRSRKLYQSFGLEHRVPETALPLRQWFFHPLWSFAWADQEELEYLRQSQRELTLLREASQQRSWSRLKEQMTAHHQSYRAPAAAWRFYAQLPFVDDMLEVMGAPQLPKTAYPYADCSNACFSTMNNLTRHELVITALALKRYALRHGHPAAHLGVLVPDYLKAMPTDFMDGQPLRYRVNAAGTFFLYSVGANLRDDAGVSDSEATNTNGQDTSPWSGRDWVWPESEANPVIGQRELSPSAR